MSRNKTPVTAATRESRGRKIDVSDNAYNYEEHGDLKVSTKELARKIGVRAISPRRSPGRRPEAGRGWYSQCVMLTLDRGN